ncbi:helix-turn-helix transcriptional regulator [Streptomonospora nanhaiensis]|uniref:Transcriptional regulator with XRE-family HTH domain n=1 Tax=Streptomonospora nanhaiensis TaxID=1323731 RepID=A0A853BPD4_9ACTN|nr:helix-turn-helix transcriptional regulator [Streptomonospora nanhaiensis]MBV2363857.1 helix-turn-helix transcriptional regulator [Streptomonospora nanhaiensis]MBX9389879.1 helix-turn-helix transcriptional regulator [Streptomonospora nanhaiensis]NYI96840.1 transcriptional regulator with XRE-family HTH domain [Streptomonospora nanhaiensis]
MAEHVREEWLPWAAKLKKIREQAGLTQAELARQALMSRQVVSKYEMATRAPKSGVASKFDEILSTGGALRQLWHQLSNSVGIPDEWRDFIQLERAADEIREYQPLVIPGLLQSPKYARAMMQRSGTRIKDGDTEGLVATRLDRLGRLRDDVHLWFVLEETAIRRVVGSVEAQLEGLSHLLELCAHESIRITVVPEYSPMRPGVLGSFRVMRLPGGNLVAHSEHTLGEVVVNEAEKVSRLLTYFGDLQSESLSTSDSMRLIEKVRGTLQ